MGGKIDVYLDSVSPYSFFAFKYLLEQRPVLESHGIEIEFIPFFLGGVNVATGNKPPWTVPAKGKYMRFDRQRACAYFGVKFIETPPGFPVLTVLPQRVLLHVKATQPAPRFEKTWYGLWSALWERGEDISQPATVSAVLASVGLAKDQIEAALAAAKDPQIKAQLEANTKRAVELGAFGAPFFSVTSPKTGTTEPFFGSDRFHYMWEFLGLPTDHLHLKEAQAAKL